MENYKLQEDEVVLYKGYVNLKNKKVKANLILTNLNVVFVPIEEELTSDEKIENTQYQKLKFIKKFRKLKKKKILLKFILKTVKNK